MENGELEKFQIHSFKDKRLTRQPGNFKVFTIPINPETYTRGLKVEYETKKGQGNQSVDPKYTGSSPAEVKLDFILDGTGTVKNYYREYIGLSVSDQIERLLTTVYYIEGSIHRPRFLKLFWGSDLPFECLLTNLDINYTLFKPSGAPLRAKVSATFLNYIDPEKRVRREDKESPDLTHLRNVEDGDTLPLMAYDIYANTNYLIQVAQANNLTSFRNLKNGQEIVFPPLEKSTT